MSKTKAVKILILLLILSATALFALRQRKPRPPGLGESAPDFTLPALNQGSLSLHDFKGQVVLVNFWATWCPPCIEEAPSLEKFAELMRTRGVIVIGVSVDQDKSALETFAAAHHLSFPIARDPGQSVAGRYGTFKFPETYIVGADGQGAEKVIGGVDWEDPRIIAFIQDLIRKGEGHGV